MGTCSSTRNTIFTLAVQSKTNREALGEMVQQESAVRPVCGAVRQHHSTQSTHSFHESSTIILAHCRVAIHGDRALQGCPSGKYYTGIGVNASVVHHQNPQISPFSHISQDSQNSQSSPLSPTTKCSGKSQSKSRSIERCAVPKALRLFPTTPCPSTAF